MIIVRLREVLLEHQLRTGEQITYSELAKRTGLSRATLEALGSRPTYNTTLSTIDKICSALGCQLSEILEYQPPDQTGQAD